MHTAFESKENKLRNITFTEPFEWWRFEGSDDRNEYLFVALFFSGNQFYETGQRNNSNYCIVSFDLYFKGRLLYSQLQELNKNKFSVEKKLGIDTIYFDKSNFYYDELEKKYYLNVNFSLADWDNRFKSEFIFSVKSDHTCNNLQESTQEFWLSHSIPECTVSSKFKFYKDYKRRKTEFTGNGYHERASGKKGIYLNAELINRGWVYTPEYSVMFLYVKYKDGKKEFKKMMTYKKGKLISDTDDFMIKPANTSFLGSGKTIEIETDNFILKCLNKKKLDHKLFSGRYESEFQLIGNGNQLIKNAKGISEIHKNKKGNFLGSFKKS